MSENNLHDAPTLPLQMSIGFWQELSFQNFLLVKIVDVFLFSLHRIQDDREIDDKLLISKQDINERGKD